MVFRQLSKVLVPGLERDLSKAIGKEMSSAHAKLDCMVAPAVHAFQEASATSGAFNQTIKASSPVRMIKVEFPIPGRGLFQ
jgi:hypothetical protein